MFEAKLKIHDNKNINNYLVIALITSQCNDKCHICLIKIFRKYKKCSLSAMVFECSLCDFKYTPENEMNEHIQSHI